MRPQPQAEFRDNEPQLYWHRSGAVHPAEVAVNGLSSAEAWECRREGTEKHSSKSQKQRSHGSVISSPARPPTHGQYLKESALRWKIAGQASEFKEWLEDSTSDPACHSQLLHRTSAPLQLPHGRGPWSPVLLHPPCARIIAGSSSHPSPRHSQRPNQLNARKQNGQNTHVQGLPTAAGVLSGEGTNLLPRSPVAGTSQVPAQPSSTAANFQGSGCLKSSCRLCLVGAEPARAAGKVTQEDTDVQEGRSPLRNPFGAAALQGRREPRHLRAQTSVSRPGTQPRRGWSHPCRRMEEKPHNRQRCRPYRCPPGPEAPARSAGDGAALCQPGCWRQAEATAGPFALKLKQTRALSCSHLC